MGNPSPVGNTQGTHTGLSGKAYVYAQSSQRDGPQARQLLAKVRPEGDRYPVGQGIGPIPPRALVDSAVVDWGILAIEEEE